MRTLGKVSAILLSVAAAAWSAAAQSRTWTEAILIERLNQAAEHFKTLTANLQYTKFTQVVEDKSVESGRLTYNQDRHILIEFLNPEPKEILFTGNKAQIYYPKMAQIQEYALDKHRSMVEQFLLLGFGTPGDKLRDSYLITVFGETRLDNRVVLQLELTPKDEKLRQHIHKIHLWLDLAAWVPVQQQFFEVGGDYLIAHYTDIKVNVPIPAARQRLSAPRGTRILKPRGSM
ncbi:MAG: outer membrane lipoprotein carrier protein LolA [Acidobacteria bacterium]|nr:outer membrane lipoprotein carrier protein LolA [Acidobacteriota bacterium]